MISRYKCRIIVKYVDALIDVIGYGDGNVHRLFMFPAIALVIDLHVIRALDFLWLLHIFETLFG